MTMAERRRMIVDAIYTLEWMEEFDKEGDPRYHDELDALLRMCDALGVVVRRESNGKIDPSGATYTNLCRMLDTIDHKRARR